MTEPTEFEVEAELQELRQANGRLQRQLTSAKRKSEALVEAVYTAAKEAALIAGPVRFPPKPKREPRTRGDEVALLHCSDWQTGKQTESFNTDVAALRVKDIGERTIKMAGIERADHPVRSCHVLLGGDMLEGVTVFPGQAWEVDSTLFSQVFATVEMIVGLLLRLLEEFESVDVWEEAGNHGRLGRKGDFPSQDNADAIVYRITQDRLKGADRLAWHPSQGWHSIVEIGEYRALLVHGDEVKSFGGQTPAFGITRKVNAWATGVVAPFTDCYMGHWHQPLVLPIAHGRGRTFVNPSLESDNVYAQEFVAATGQPGQRLNFVDPKRGRVTTERILWVD